MGDKNGGARVYVIAIMFLLPRAIKVKEFVAILLCFICLLISKSASGVLMLAIGLSTYFYFNIFLSTNRFTNNLKIYLLGSFFYCIGCFIIYQLSQVIINILGRSSDLTDRGKIWDILLPMVQEKINFGYGFGAFWASHNADGFIERWGYIGNAHNGYIEMLLHGGLGFILIFGVMVIASLKNIMIKASSGHFFQYQNVSLAVLIQLLIVNFVAYSLPNHNAIDFLVFTIIILYSNAIITRPVSLIR
jgi:O-antigen ligase